MTRALFCSFWSQCLTFSCCATLKQSPASRKTPVLCTNGCGDRVLGPVGFKIAGSDFSLIRCFAVESFRRSTILLSTGQTTSFPVHPVERWLPFLSLFFCWGGGTVETCSNSARERKRGKPVWWVKWTTSHRGEKHRRSVLHTAQFRWGQLTCAQCVLLRVLRSHLC